MPTNLSRIRLSQRVRAASKLQHPRSSCKVLDKEILKHQVYLVSLPTTNPPRVLNVNEHIKLRSSSSYHIIKPLLCFSDVQDRIQFDLGQSKPQEFLICENPNYSCPATSRGPLAVLDSSCWYSPEDRLLSSESQTHQNAGKMRRSRWSQPHGKTFSATVCSRMLLCNCEFTPGFFEVTWILACQVNPVGMQGCFNSCSMKTKTKWKPTALHAIKNERGSPLGRLYDCIWNSSLQSFEFWFKQLNFN